MSRYISTEPDQACLKSPNLAIAHKSAPRSGRRHYDGQQDTAIHILSPGAKWSETKDGPKFFGIEPETFL